MTCCNVTAATTAAAAVSWLVPAADVGVVELKLSGVLLVSRPIALFSFFSWLRTD